MKKVLFFIPTLGQGGAEKVLVNLVNNMDRNKFDITVQVLFKGGINEQFLKTDIKFKYVYKNQFRGNSKYFCLYSPEHLYKRFIKEKYDIIVSYLEGPTARIVSGCTNKNTKLVSWIHVEQHTKNVLSASFRNFTEAKKCYNSFDMTVCVSEYVKNDFVNILNFIKPVKVLYNTIETDNIKELADSWVDDYRFSLDSKTLIAVGTLKKSKGFDRLIRVHKKLIDSGIKNNLIILGTGSERNSLNSLIDELNVTESCKLLGYNTNPYKYIKRSDIFVCSSYAEGFSTAATEALIVGTPVVTVDVSGMKEMLGKNNEYGIVTENDEDALYEGIKKILTNSELLRYYSKKAFERGKKFSTDSTVRDVENSFDLLF